MRYYRRVIKITADDSPNVRYGRWLEERGRPLPEADGWPVPGVLHYDEYKKRRATWDAIRQCVGLDAEFYAGKELLLFPPEWLNHAEGLWRERRVPFGLTTLTQHRTGQFTRATAVGIDPAEGGDKTAMAAVNEFGLVELVSRKTPNTNDVYNEALAFVRRHGVEPNRVAWDRGGGGKQHADRMRAAGLAVRTVAFGEPIQPDPRRQRNREPYKDRVDQKETRYEYATRRAQMFGELSELLDPSYYPAGFALPPGSAGTDAVYAELRFQLSKFPKKYVEGKLTLPPKDRKGEDGGDRTLKELIGHSPDEADALVLAVFAMLHKPSVVYAGAV